MLYNDLLLHSCSVLMEIKVFHSLVVSQCDVCHKDRFAVLP